MSDPEGGRQLVWLKAGLVIAGVICVSAFGIELLRALGGNTLSWAYVFEWPLLLGYAVFMWHRLVREQHGLEARPPAESTAQELDDLEAWNRYLAALHAEDAAGRIEQGREYT